MRKRWIPLLIACIATAFIFGLRLGADREAENWHNAQSIEFPIRISSTIAVVNADAGVVVDGIRTNFSAAIIDTLGDNFSLVSPAMAQTGLFSGLYSAVVTFPSNVSVRVLSFNAHQPQRVQLDFTISPMLSEREFLETYISITELQLAINTTLANTYVSSIFRQFHDAQDQVHGIFQNDLANLMALELLTLHDFTEQLDLDEVPVIPLNPRELDTHFYMTQVADFANEVANWYLNSYQMASNEFLWMREGLFRLTDGFEHQEDDWLFMLEDWTRYSIEYGELLEIFAGYVSGHDESLYAWFRENVIWNARLLDFQTQLSNWHDYSRHWFETGEVWYHDYQAHLNAVSEFQEALAIFQVDLDESADSTIDGLTQWFDALEEYEQGMYTQFNLLTNVVDSYNIHSEDANAFFEYLMYWHSLLYEHHTVVSYWNNEVNQRQVHLNELLTTLTENHEDIQYVIDMFLAVVETTPDIYDTAFFDTNLEEYWDTIIVPDMLDVSKIYIPEWSVTTPASLTVELPTDVMSSPDIVLPALVMVTTGAAITIPPQPIIGEDLNFYLGHLQKWHSDLNQVAEILRNWNTYLQSKSDEMEMVADEMYIWHNAMQIWHGSLQGSYDEFHLVVDEVQDWYDELHLSFIEMLYMLYRLVEFNIALHDFHEDIYVSMYDFNEWQYNLSNLSDMLYEWHYQLRTYTDELLEWYGTLYLADLPELPDYSEWSYLEAPEEAAQGVPDEVELLEMMELPNWDDSIIAPIAYSGTRIADAFDRNFPLDVVSMTTSLDLERPPHYDGDEAPDEVDEHFMMTAEQPTSPLISPPPRPDDFWHSLGSMHEQLSTFDVNAFLSDDIHERVDTSLDSYAEFLDYLRDHLNVVFEDNIWLMRDIHTEYNFFLQNLRLDAFATQAAEQYALQTTINEFATINEGNSGDTRFRLNSFANMMPESRLPGGINQTLVDFAVAPFEFISLDLQEDVVLTPTHVPLESMAYTYWYFQRMAVIMIGVVFFVTLAISYTAYLFGKKKAKREMKKDENYAFSSIG